MSKSTSATIKVTKAASSRGVAKKSTTKSRVSKTVTKKIKKTKKIIGSKLKTRSASKTTAKPKTSSKTTKTKSQSPSPKGTKARTKTKSSARVKTKASENDPELKPSKNNGTVIPTPPLKDNTAIIKRNPLGHLLIEKILREAGFKGGISTSPEALSRYSTDESIFAVKPQVVLQPINRHDVEVTVKTVMNETKRFESLSITPRGGGNSFTGSSLSDSVVVDMSIHLNNIQDPAVRKDQLIFSVEAGAMWRDVQKKLKTKKAYLPTAFSVTETSTVAGVLGDSYNNSTLDFVISVDAILADGHTYTVKPLTYKEFKALTKEKHQYANILKQTLAFLYKNEKTLKQNNKLGQHSLKQILPQGKEAFLKGEGKFNLIPFLCSAEGAVGIVVGVKLKALPIQPETSHLTVPVFNLEEMPSILNNLKKFNPVNLSVIDGTTIDTALRNPSFFKKHIEGMNYYRSLLSLYTTYHVRFGKKTPEFIILATFDKETIEEHSGYEIITSINTQKTRARMIVNEDEVEMLKLLTNTYYSLAKLRDQHRRPATFLKDVQIPYDRLVRFITEVKNEHKELTVPLTIYSGGKENYFSFYPHLDFSQKTTPILIEKLTHKFYALVERHQGSIREGFSPLLPLQLPVKSGEVEALASIRNLYAELEDIFDPDDIFNSRRKTFPRFKSGETIRNTN